VPGEYQTAIAEHKHFDTVLMTARMMEGNCWRKAPQFLASHPKQRPNGLCSTFDGTHCSRSGFQGLTSPLKDLSESYAAQIRRLQSARDIQGACHPARKVSFRIARSRIRFAISILTWKTHLSSQKPLTLIQNGFAERHH
jgi:hypothetical protein